MADALSASIIARVGTRPGGKFLYGSTPSHLVWRANSAANNALDVVILPLMNYNPSPSFPIPMDWKFQLNLPLYNTYSSTNSNGSTFMMTHSSTMYSTIFLLILKKIDHFTNPV